MRFHSNSGRSKHFASYLLVGGMTVHHTGSDSPSEFRLEIRIVIPVSQRSLSHADPSQQPTWAQAYANAPFLKRLEPIDIQTVVAPPILNARRPGLVCDNTMVDVVCRVRFFLLWTPCELLPFKKRGQHLFDVSSHYMCSLV